MEHCLLGLTMSLAPIALHLLLHELGLVIACSSALFVLGLVGMFLLAMQKLIYVQPRRPRMIIFTWFVPNIGVTLLLSHSVFYPHAGLLVLGLLWLLISFAIQLLHFIYPPLHTAG